MRPRTQWMATRLRFAVLVGVLLVAPAALASVGRGVASDGARTAAVINQSSGAFREHVAAVPTTSRVRVAKSFRADLLVALLAAAWTALVVGLWLTRARLRVNPSLARFVSVRPRGPPFLLRVS